jgi:hypothetical protein
LQSQEDFAAYYKNFTAQFKGWVYVRRLLLMYHRVQCHWIYNSFYIF